MSTAEKTLKNCRILIVEDEYLLADELRVELECAGATVLGPISALIDAIELIQIEQNIDGALLDANLGGEMVFSAADMLIERGVPIVFTTGYDASVIPSRFGTVARCEKPVSIKHVTQTIGRAIHA